MLSSLPDYERLVYTLQAVYPLIEHPPPDIKHYRVPAPGPSFDRPNLPFLIKEIERDLLGLQ